MTAPVEKKVQASSYAAALSGLALFALGRYVFRGDVPDVVVSWVYVAVPAALTFTAGYFARHTPRPDGPAGNMPADMPARGGYSAGGRTVSDLPPPPPSVTTSPPEKTLQPPGEAPPS